MRDLVGGPRRFVELQRVLPGISTEQLRSRLNRMVADGLLTRQRYREVPPRVDYELTERARDLLPVVGALARWGYQWTWTPPHADEHVDIGAVLRSLSGLAAPSGLQGTAELVVKLRGGQEKAYVLTVRSGAIGYAEGAADAADCRIAGPESAWVDALGPEASRAGLQLSGDQRLAGALLDLAAPVAAREAAVA